MRTIRMVLAVGGPLHGRYLPDGPASLLVRGERPQNAVLSMFSDPTEEALSQMPDLREVTYHRRLLIVPGWTVFVGPLDVYTTWPLHSGIPDGIVLPGHVTRVPAEHHPLGCRCAPVLIDNRETEMKP